MADKIFYSWQSDSPDATNRRFIEGALTEAIGNLGQQANELYKPPRDIEIDKDTEGIPGAPPIAVTIFSKIERCALFVPDLTFVATSEEGRLTPNPNVLIEYGWALAKCGYSRIVGVANTTFGELTNDSVPFDLRHHRWPIQYNLEEDADADHRNAVRAQLVKELTTALGEVLSTVPAAAAEAAYSGLEPKSRISSFLDEGDVLCKLMPWGVEEASDIIWHDSPQLFLRVIPQVPIPEKTPLELREMIKEGGILPFGRVYGTWTEGNQFGAVIFEAKNQARQETANRIVQVSDRGEVWAIDGFSIRESEAVPFIEVPYAKALASYLRFSREQLGVESRVKVIAGMTGVIGMQMWRPPPPEGHMYTDPEKKLGNAVRDTIVGEIEDVTLEPENEIPLKIPGGFMYQLEDPLSIHAYHVLMPFFHKFWGIFQLKRPDFLPH